MERDPNLNGEHRGGSRRLERIQCEWGRGDATPYYLPIELIEGTTSIHLRLGPR